MSRGATPAQALALAEHELTLITATEIQDAGRTAVQAAMVARPEIKGYVRALTPPSCSRCVVLAGKFYRWNEGFSRHPNCDCFHIPVTDLDQVAQEAIDPLAAIKANQVTGLSKAEKSAILEGADVFQVINSRRGMYTAAGRKLTREGASKRGLAGSRGAKVRLRPEQIFREAGGNRQLALDMLRANGYVI